MPPPATLDGSAPDDDIAPDNSASATGSVTSGLTSRLAKKAISKYDRFFKESVSGRTEVEPGEDWTHWTCELCK